MAYRRKGGNVVLKALGQVVGLLLSLYVFNEILDAIWATINDTTSFFYDAVAFTEDLLPVMGILGVFFVIYRALQKTGMV